MREMQQGLVCDLNKIYIQDKAKTYHPPGTLALIFHNNVKKMSKLLTAMNGDRADNNGSKKMRDKAYTYLKEAVDEIRAGGKYVFWKNEKRLKGYRSEYHRRK